MIRATFSISPAGSTLVQCSKTNLIWTESPPIHLWAAPNRDISPGDPTLIDFGIINETYILWTVNLPVGQNVSFTYAQQSDPDNLLSSPVYSSRWIQLVMPPFLLEFLFLF
ncbi:hypothetical protein WOLCODRAFT_148284 [Wolfiporia cocos MD-104 SS10]|uniref:Uncharacterized protein n=1 Tax=Wolfiporia cocos (strain MD-104) TaxID=742152 RepID=A0A2H3IW57_WOLCO|nr:hypothetical protein WOLCODRAFT_148284 [Wolfiporia cocos MD-104 SS10]